MCPARVCARIEHFASAAAMDIEGLGEAVVEQLVSLVLCADLYSLHRERLLELERCGQEHGQSITAIEASKTRPFRRVPSAIGIRHVGPPSSLPSSLAPPQP